jgi:hypothetical protein
MQQPDLRHDRVEAASRSGCIGLAVPHVVQPGELDSPSSNRQSGRAVHQQLRAAARMDPSRSFHARARRILMIPQDSHHRETSWQAAKPLFQGVRPRMSVPLVASQHQHIRTLAVQSLQRVPGSRVWLPLEEMKITYLGDRRARERSRQIGHQERNPVYSNAIGGFGISKGDGSGSGSHDSSSDKAPAANQILIHLRQYQRRSCQVLEFLVGENGYSGSSSP